MNYFFDKKGACLPMMGADSNCPLLALFFCRVARFTVGSIEDLGAFHFSYEELFYTELCDERVQLCVPRHQLVRLAHVVCKRMSESGALQRYNDAVHEAYECRAQIKTVLDDIKLSLETEVAQRISPMLARLESLTGRRCGAQITQWCEA